MPELPLHLAQLVLLRIRHGGRLGRIRLSKGTEHTCIAEAKRNIIAISLQDAAAKSQSGEAVIVDVREKDEWGRRTDPKCNASESWHDRVGYRGGGITNDEIIFAYPPTAW